MATSVLAAIQYAQQLAQTDANGIGSALGLAFYNDALQTMTRDLAERGVDATGTAEAYRNLAVDPTSGLGTFLWPDDMRALKTVEVNWSDQNPQNFVQATAFDVANIQGESFSWLRANQSTSQPLFDNRGDWAEIFPTPITSNANGIRIFYWKKPTEATNVGEAIEYPATQDYRMLSAKMASLYYKSQDNSNTAAVYEQEYRERINKIIKILAPGTQQPIQPKPLSLTGWNF